jgi:hypothetical protein
MRKGRYAVPSTAVRTRITQKIRGLGTNYTGTALLIKNTAAAMWAAVDAGCTNQCAICALIATPIATLANENAPLGLGDSPRLRRGNRALYDASRLLAGKRGWRIFDGGRGAVVFVGLKSLEHCVCFHRRAWGTFACEIKLLGRGRTSRDQSE